MSPSGHGYVVAATLLTLTACERRPHADRADGIEGAFDDRPHETVRDAGADVGDAVKEAGRAAKDVVDGD